jgi:hypothetical protein
MNQNICIPPNYFLTLVMFFIILTIIYLYYKHKLLIIQNNNQSIQNNNQSIQNNNQSIQNNSQSIQNNSQSIQNKNNIIIDDNKGTLSNSRYIDLNTLPVRQLIENRDRSVLYDPLVAPERRFNIAQNGNDNYQLIGIGTRNSDEKIIQIFSRPTFPRSNQYEYYVITSTDGFVNKIPIQVKGKKELNNNDVINVNRLGDFQVNLYDYNTPRYNPNVF